MTGGWTWVPVTRKQYDFKVPVTGASRNVNVNGNGNGNGNGKHRKAMQQQRQQRQQRQQQRARQDATVPTTTPDVEMKPMSAPHELAATKVLDEEQLRCIRTITDIYSRLSSSSRVLFAENVCEQLGTQANLLIRLCHERARDLVKDKVGYKPLTVDKGDPLYKVLKMMTQTNILAFPVLDKKTYCGFLDASHLVTYACQLCSVNTKSTIGLSKNRTFRMTTVEQIMGVSPPGIPYNSSVCLASELMAQTGLRRVPVVNFYNQVIAVVTQSMLIEWLVKNINAVNPAYRDMPTTSAKAYRWVAYVKETDTVLQAFLKMQKMGVQGLAVINAKGVLVDQVSFRDLRGLGTSSLSFSMMLESVKTLRAMVRSQFPDTDAIEGCSIFNMCILNSERLETTLNRMVKHKLRRVFVVDSMETLKPENTISQTDIIRYMMNSLSRTASLSAIPYARPQTQQQPLPIDLTTGKSIEGIVEGKTVESEAGLANKSEADKEMDEKARQVAMLVWDYVNKKKKIQENQPEMDITTIEKLQDVELRDSSSEDNDVHQGVITSSSFVPGLAAHKLSPERVRHLVVPRAPKKQKRPGPIRRAQNPTKLVFPQPKSADLINDQDGNQ